MAVNLSLELEPPSTRTTIARDPASSIGREEGNHVTDIVRLERHA